MLYILSGLPGTGKSTLAEMLARHLQAVYLRIDTIEQAMRAGGLTLNGPEGYVVAYQLAADNLRLGLNVVADSVNPIEITRAAWREVALQADGAYIEIEVICSDAAEHRRRVENRVVSVAGLRLPTWDEVVNRPYEPWDSSHLQIDTAHATIEESFADLLRQLKK